MKVFMMKIIFYFILFFSMNLKALELLEMWPDYFFASKNQKCTIELKGGVVIPEKSNYQFFVVGKLAPDGTYSFIPQDKININVEVLINSKRVSQKKIDCLVAQPLKNEINRKFVFIGDYIMENKYFFDSIQSYFRQAKINCDIINPQKTIIRESSYMSFASSSQWNVTPDSPFVFKTDNQKSLDFKQFLKNNSSQGEIDYVLVLLSCSDVLRFPSNQSFKNQSYAESLIDNIKLAAPKAVIGVCLMPLPGFQDLFYQFGPNVSCYWEYINKLRLFNRSLIALFLDRRKENIYIIPLNLCIDSKKDFYIKNLNDKHNCFAPDISGYRKIASMITSWVLWSEANIIKKDNK